MKIRDQTLFTINSVMRTQPVQVRVEGKTGFHNCWTQKVNTYANYTHGHVFVILQTAHTTY